MQEQLKALEGEARGEIEQAATLEQVEELRVRYLGRKGKLTLILRGMKDLPSDERPLVGKLGNEIRARLEDLLQQRRISLQESLKRERLERERLDVTMPGARPRLGNKHPLTLVLEEIKEIFMGLGFSVVEGPEIETDYYNFEALNLPPNHPARDMQDSFYITEKILLRTHTSPVQARTMERTAPAVPVRIICPGKVYRRDADSTHSPMFHQVEGLVVDRNVTLAHLKGVLTHFAREVFGADRKVRFRPSYFPFTEPSAEVDISCVICGGRGCRVCSHTGWLEILGSGLVHPRVLAMSGYDPDKVSGFAFGMGVERIAMLKYGIDDIRLFFENNLRFLEQFGIG
ncbi:MAG TPA: phenylalanine--tRNA ligase subunit alpha [Firmicutes bacterium]|nr:phenylalanine--tRNA ligase subunit alpha [Bacillota bacterium]